MQLRFQNVPWDLYFVYGYVVAVAGTVLVFGAASFLAFPLILIVPGYLITSTLFPSDKELDWIERLALSVGLSIAVVPLLGLLLNLTQFGVLYVPLLSTVFLFILVASAFALWRRMRLPSDRRLASTIQLSLPDWKSYSRWDKVVTISLCFGVVVAGGTLAFLFESRTPSSNFTSFNLLGPTGNASGYPTTLNISQSGTVIISVANHESAIVDYALRVDLVGIRVIYDATGNPTEIIEANRTTLSWMNATSGDGQNWTRPYSFSILSAGLWKIQFLLFKNGDFLSSYRELHLFIRVT